MDIYNYLEKKEEQLYKVINNPLLNNNYNQMVALRMGAEFQKTYNEIFLWNQALFLSSTSTKILNMNNSNLIALKAMRLAAQIYEMIYYVSKKYDKGFSILMSAICYDIAGYQANALCLIKELYILEQDDIAICKYENIFLELVQLFIQKKMTLLKIKSSKAMQSLMEDNNVDQDYYVAFNLFFKVVNKISNAFLYGKENINENLFCNSTKFNNQIDSWLRECIDNFMHCGNIPLTNISTLFQSKYKLMRERSTWDSINKLNKLPNDIWECFLKLLSLNIYNDNKYIEEKDRTSIFEFWNSQLNALKTGLISTDNSYIVQMPTSAGKTMIAEVSILDSLIKMPERKCLYIAPFRALASEVEDCLSNHLGRIGYIVSNVTGNYEIDKFDDFLIKEADVLVATPEKIDLLLRLRPDFFNEVSLIVIDEGHVLGNLDERSSLFELLITRLKRKLKDRVKFLFISAVMPDINAEQFAQWLCENKGNRITSPKDKDGIAWQPTRRLIGKFTWRGENGRIDFPTLKIPETRSQNAFIPSIVKVNQYDTLTPKKKKVKKVFFPDKKKKSDTAVELAYKYSVDAPVLIFCAHPGFVYNVAESFLKLLNLRGINANEHFNQVEDLESIEIAKKWMGDCTLTYCLQCGIGLHYGDLAQPIRKAIENDFRNKKLRVLISTNTLGQGVNLPIKTIIIHSLIINPKTKRRVKIRDFWNIVGRAGRAGKETEGQIIFLCTSDNDSDLFDEYSNENNIEQVNSVIYLLLSRLLSNRISQEDFASYLSLLVESELFAILVEECVNTPDENIIKNILGDSLASIQAVGLDSSILVSDLLEISNNFYTEAQDEKKRKTFAQTGLSLNSCKRLLAFIESNEEKLKNQLFQSESINEYIKSIIESFQGIDEMHPEKGKVSKLNIWDNIDFIKSFIDNWINGVDISELRELWENYSEEYTADNMNVFIEELLAYKFPWGITSFNLMFAYQMGMEFEDMPNIISYISSYLKYGTNNVFASWAKGMGTPTRESANVLGNAYLKSNSKEDLKEFVRWYANLTYDDLKMILNVDTSHEIIRILSQAQKINVEKTVTQVGKIRHREFYVKGIPFESRRIELAKIIEVGDDVELFREYSNIYDSYAIKVIFNGEHLGYVPREFAKELAIDIDLYSSKFIGKVTSKKVFKNNHVVYIEVSLFEG